MMVIETNLDVWQKLEPTTAIEIAQPHAPSAKHPVSIYLGRLTKNSRAAMRQSLNVIAGIIYVETNGISDNSNSANNNLLWSIDWPALRYAHAQIIRARLAEKYAPASANRHLAALRGLLKECWRLGLTSGDDYQRAIDIETIRGESLPAGRSITGDELVKLFDTCAADDRPAGRRDGAIIAVLYGCGLRCTECTSLELRDYNSAAGTILVRLGKGNKQRLAHIKASLKQRLDAWIEVRGKASGALFVPITKMSKIPEVKSMSGTAVVAMLEKRAKQAGVIDPFSPHDFRRSFISDLFAQGADMANVQKLAGHSSPTTTSRYDRRGEDSRAKIIETFHQSIRDHA